MKIPAGKIILIVSCFFCDCIAIGCEISKGVSTIQLLIPSLYYEL